jgi:hypothetical protein
MRARLKQIDGSQLTFVFDGELGLDSLLADVALSPRCVWHGPRGLYHALWRHGLGKRDSSEHLAGVKHLIGIQVPEGDLEILAEHDKDQVKSKYESSKREIGEFIETFGARGYQNAVSYLQNLTGQPFTNIDLWLQTDLIATKSISLLERVFGEFGRRLKKIAWGWKDTTATKLSKMILLKTVFQRQMGALLERETQHSWQLPREHRLGEINILSTLLNVIANLLTFKSVDKVHKG